MNHRRIGLSFVVLWWTLGVGLFLLGGETALAAARTNSPGRLHPLIVGSVEVVAAALFLIPATVAIGAAGLLLSIATAIIVHAGEGVLPIPLFIYAAGVLFVAMHGRLRKSTLTSQAPARAE
jgi:hypothetical protein